MKDPRVGKTFHAISCGHGASNDKPLGTVTLIKKIGPGHFTAVLKTAVRMKWVGKSIEIYSCQLRGETNG